MAASRLAFIVRREKKRQKYYEATIIYLLKSFRSLHDRDLAKPDLTMPYIAPDGEEYGKKNEHFV